MIKTYATWTMGSVNQRQRSEIEATVQTMKNAGKTDGIASMVISPDPATQRTYVRQWTSTEYAQEWLQYIRSFNPIIADILPD